MLKLCSWPRFSSSSGASLESTPNPSAVSHNSSQGPLPAIFVGTVVIGIFLMAIMGENSTTPWNQNYDPTGKWWMSAIIATLPVIVLLCSLAVFRIRAHYSALLGLVTALVIATGVFRMPVKTAGMTAIYGATYGLFPIGWIILNVIFMYQLTQQTGRFKVLQNSLTGITQDTRLQLLLVAFSFGAFFEGAAGFGTPVAVTAALLIGLGFKPLQASGLSLIANTAPVAYGALGTPIVGLSKVTGFSEMILGAQAGRILPFFSLLIPFWLIWAYAGFSEMIEIWPAVLVAGVAFAIPQFLVSNYHGPWLVDVVAAICSMAALVLFLKIWHPKKIWGLNGHNAVEERQARGTHGHSRSEVLRAWAPWLVLCVVVFCWGTQTGKSIFDTPEKIFTSLANMHPLPSAITAPKIPVGGVNNMVQRVPPVVAKPTPEPAVFTFNWISMTGSGILVAALISGLIMGVPVGKMFTLWWSTVWRV